MESDYLMPIIYSFSLRDLLNLAVDDLNQTIISLMDHKFSFNFDRDRLGPGIDIMLDAGQK